MRPVGTPSAPPILVVDDDPSIREGLALALAGSYLVHEAATGHEACRALESHPIHAIILDAILGEEHGLDLVDRFRTLSPAPILLLTGYSTEELAIRAVRAQVTDYLKKPPNLDELRARLARLVSPAPRPLDPPTRLHLHLENHLGKALDLGTLAGQFGLTEGHFRCRFREAYGQTPRQYLTEIRMRRAAELLRVKGLTIEEIAREVGYPNALRFARVFKRRFTLTPSEFRVRQLRSEQNPS